MGSFAAGHWPHNTARNLREWTESSSDFRFRDEADMRGDAGRADGGGKVADRQGSALSFVAGGGGDKAYRALYSRDIGIAFAGVGGENCKDVETGSSKCIAPLRSAGEVEIAMQSKLPGANTEAVSSAMVSAGSRPAQNITAVCSGSMVVKCGLRLLLVKLSFWRSATPPWRIGRVDSVLVEYCRWRIP